MVVGLDGRVLLEEFPSGVSQAARELFHAVIQASPKHWFVLFVSGFNIKLIQERTVEFSKYQHVRLKVVRCPNRFINLSIAFFRWPRLDVLAGGVEVWFSPNIGFVSLRSARLVMYVHDATFVQLNGLLKPYTRMWHFLIRPKALLLSADQVLTPSHHSRTSIQAYFHVSPERVSVIPFGPPLKPQLTNEVLKQVKERHSLPDRFSLTVGTIEPRKNIRTLIEAWTPDLGPLVIIGAKGWDDLPQHPQVHYLGYVSHQEKWAILQQASAVIYPTIAEGFGLPLLEAFAANVPVVAGPHTSLVEVGQDAVLWTNVHDQAAVRKAVQAVLEDDRIRQQLMTQGQQRLQEYSWKKTAQQVLQLLEHTHENRY